MKTTLQNLKERRSCRSYLPEQITEQELDAVLEAGAYAPTGRGFQAPVLVAIQDPALIARLERQNAAIMGTPEGKPFYGAPTVVVVLAVKSRPTYLYDGSCAMCNMLNAAHALGLGSCWIHRAREEFDSPEGKALLKEWGLEGEYEGIGHCLLGYPAGDLPAPQPRKEGHILKIR